jgi:RNA polymerase sigma-70 factor, ECF subfamily
MGTRADIHSRGATARTFEPDGPVRKTGTSLTAAEFARRYEESRRTLWFIAAAILGDRALAHDVVQETAAVAMSKLADFDSSTNFVAWMGQIVRYVALNEARSRQRRRAVRAGDAEELGVSRPAGVNLADQALDEHVASGLMSLEESARTCLVLRVVHGMSYSEISQALNIPEGTAMSHVHRSRLALRERLRGREEEIRGVRVGPGSRSTGGAA